MAFSFVRLRPKPHPTGSDDPRSAVCTNTDTFGRRSQLAPRVHVSRPRQSHGSPQPTESSRPPTRSTSGNPSHPSAATASRQHRTHPTHNRTGRSVQAINIRARTRIRLWPGAYFAFSDVNIPKVKITSQAAANKLLTNPSSHYNTAHFLNPDFQPEEWSPDTEYGTGNKGRHKSTSQ